jgi:hypothetical protein
MQSFRHRDVNKAVHIDPTVQELVFVYILLIDEIVASPYPVYCHFTRGSTSPNSNTRSLNAKQKAYIWAGGPKTLKAQLRRDCQGENQGRQDICILGTK